jgi:alcohol dehydrogenase
MRALVFDQSLRLESHRPEPAAAMGDALLRVRQAGICTTDLEICKGYMNFAGVLGHEFVADVVQSPDATLVGKRVVGEINCVCTTCERCLRGLKNHCPNRTVLGILRRDGAFADFVRLPTINLHPLPDLIDDDQAVFVEPLAAAFAVLRDARIDARTMVTVLGDGRLGMLCAQVIRNAGAPVRLVGRNPSKLALCDKWEIKSRLVADIQPRADQDVIVDCTGSPEGLELALRMVRPRGTVVLKSTFAAGKPMNLASVVIDEVSVVGSRCGPFPQAIEALARREVDVLSLIHRRYRLDQGVDAMNTAGQRGVLKVLLKVA